MSTSRQNCTVLVWDQHHLYSTSSFRRVTQHVATDRQIRGSTKTSATPSVVVADFSAALDVRQPRLPTGKPEVSEPEETDIPEDAQMAQYPVVALHTDEAAAVHRQAPWSRSSYWCWNNGVNVHSHFDKKVSNIRASILNATPPEFIKTNSAFPGFQLITLFGSRRRSSHTSSVQQTRYPRGWLLKSVRRYSPVHVLSFLPLDHWRLVWFRPLSSPPTSARC